MPDTTPPWARTADAADLDADALAYRQLLSKELFKLHASSVPRDHRIRRNYLAGTWREPADQVRSYLAARILKRYGTARELTRDANAWDLLADTSISPHHALASVAKLIDRTSKAPSKEDLRRVAQWLYGEVWDDMNPMLDHEIERYWRDDNENRLVVIPTGSSLWRVLARLYSCHRLIYWTPGGPWCLTEMRLPVDVLAAFEQNKGAVFDLGPTAHGLLDAVRQLPEPEIEDGPPAPLMRDLAAAARSAIT